MHTAMHISAMTPAAMMYVCVCVCVCVQEELSKREAELSEAQALAKETQTARAETASTQAELTRAQVRGTRSGLQAHIYTQHSCATLDISSAVCRHGACIFH